MSCLRVTELIIIFYFDILYILSTFSRLISIVWFSYIFRRETSDKMERPITIWSPSKRAAAIFGQ